MTTEEPRDARPGPAGDTSQDPRPGSAGDATRDASERRGSLRAYAQLVRLPNLFTAPPDVLLGAALAAGAGGVVPFVAVAGLAVASVLLYAGGTTLNDYADRAEDARDRPERPIPSGAVDARRALAIGVGLLVAGIGIAWAVAGPVAGAVAAALAGAIGLYDGALKGSIPGSVTMGACRGLNVVLGATTATAVGAFTGPAATATTTGPLPFPTPVLAVAGVVVVYIAGVTSMAEAETGASGRGPVLVGIAAVAVAAAGVVGLAVVRSPPPLQIGLAAALLVGFLAWTGRALRTAYADPGPGTIGPAVGACVLGIVALDAAFAATVGPAWSLAALAFAVPAVGLAGRFDVS